tara:strand:- start:39861 stop:40112 length:252 start_codon:yes stop_codon:yes gene_type:complete
MKTDEGTLIWKLDKIYALSLFQAFHGFFYASLIRIRHYQKNCHLLLTHSAALISAPHYPLPTVWVKPLAIKVGETRNTVKVMI